MQRGSKACRDKESKRLSEREVWPVPESRASAYYFDLDF